MTAPTIQVDLRMSRKGGIHLFQLLQRHNWAVGAPTPKLRDSRWRAFHRALDPVECSMLFHFLQGQGLTYGVDQLHLTNPPPAMAALVGQTSRPKLTEALRREFAQCLEAITSSMVEGQCLLENSPTHDC